MQVIARDLAHSFDGGASLFRDLNFVLDAGDLTALVGPSGSGKSTLLSLMAGWMRPTSGSMELVGVESIAWVFQNPHGIARRSALDHVTLPLLATGYSRAEADTRAEEILVRFGLADRIDVAFAALSGGEAQRLMLARAVARSPSLLLVDEPTAQLDQMSAAAVNTVLSELAMNRSIVVVATHDDDTRDACKRVLDLRSAVPSTTRWADQGS